MKWSYSLVLSVIAWIVTGCATLNQPQAPSRPVWIDNPGKGVSASAGMHVGGRVAQEELAIQRAREEYAKRFGINIQSEQITSSTVTNDRVSTVSQKVTQENMKQDNVKGMIKEKWREPDSDVLWVWLVPSE